MRRSLTPRGFTMVELLLVLVLIGLISVVAFPALFTFSSRNDDANAATKVSRLVNRVKDQARRRNRAHLVVFEEMSTAQPQGRMTIRETGATSCSLTDLEATRIISEVPFGGTLVPTYRGERTEEVGIAGWRRVGGGDRSTLDLTLCASPSGALAVGVGEEAAPLAGQLELFVQRFDRRGGGWGPMGPPRAIEMTYAGNARLELK